MTSQCTLHNQPMTERTSKTKFADDGTPKTYWAHNLADNSLCFGESQGKASRNGRGYNPAPAAPKAEEPDWDGIARGKTRCAIFTAVVGKDGLEAALASKAHIELAVSYIMHGLPGPDEEPEF